MPRSVTQCPVCDASLRVTELSCVACDTKLHGTFAPPPLSRLPDQHQQFIETFVLCRGVIRDVEQVLGVSYPTVRARLDAAVAALEAVRELPSTSAQVPLEGTAKRSGAPVYGPNKALDFPTKGGVAAAADAFLAARTAGWRIASGPDQEEVTNFEANPDGGFTATLANGRVVRRAASALHGFLWTVAADWSPIPVEKRDWLSPTAKARLAASRVEKEAPMSSPTEEEAAVSDLEFDHDFAPGAVEASDHPSVVDQRRELLRQVESGQLDPGEAAEILRHLR